MKNNACLLSDVVWAKLWWSSLSMGQGKCCNIGLLMLPVSASSGVPSLLPLQHCGPCCACSELFHVCNRSSWSSYMLAWCFCVLGDLAHLSLYWLIRCQLACPWMLGPRRACLLHVLTIVHPDPSPSGKWVNYNLPTASKMALYLSITLMLSVCGMNC